MSRRAEAAELPKENVTIKGEFVRHVAAILQLGADWAIRASAGSGSRPGAHRLDAALRHRGRLLPTDGIRLLAVAVALLACAGCAAWVELTPSGSTPPNRWQHSAVYAPAHSRMIVYGGKLPTTPYGSDVWVLTGAHGKGVTPRWIQLKPGGAKPAGRHEHTAVYDSASDRMVVFGGHSPSGSPFAADLWVLEHASGVGGAPRWSALTPSGPAPASREWHTAVYDAASRRMILFGGLDNNGKSRNDAWVLENANGLGGSPRWVELAPGGTRPPPRVAHSAVYDAATNSMVVFGGSGVDGFSGFLADTWRLENANGLGGSPRWRQVVAAGTAPPARENHTAIADGKGGMIVFGGWTTVRYFSDSWWLKNVFGGGPITWINLRPRGKVPQAREAAAAVFDPATRRMILFAGSFSSPAGVPPGSRCDSGSCTHDLWVLPR